MLKTNWTGICHYKFKNFELNNELNLVTVIVGPIFETIMIILRILTQIYKKNLDKLKKAQNKNLEKSKER